MKLKHWIKQYRSQKAYQRATTKYWQRAAAEERITKRLLRIAAARTAVLMRNHLANSKFPSGGLQNTNTTTKTWILDSETTEKQC